jgi:hypothetical protein
MARHAVFSEHDSEPLKGLPEALPAGEQVLWQGAPAWRGLALDAYRVRALSVYFAVIVVARCVWLLASGVGLPAALAGCVGPAAFSLLCVGLLTGLAALAARATVYTITNRRVVIRHGVALSSSVNLPFTVLKSADFRERGTHGGDIVLSLLPGERISYLWMWPHVRPWRYAHPQPALRNLPDADRAGQILSLAFASTARQAQDARHAAADAAAPGGEPAQAHLAPAETLAGASH